MRVRIVNLVNCMMVFALISCSNGNYEPGNKVEIVMTDGMSISATNSFGTLKITAGKGTTRYYTWNGATRKAALIPRKDRWNGSLGLYFPGQSNHWKEHDGITRAVLEEGQQHFNSIKDAVDWINKDNHIGYVYRDDGLVVGWDKMLGAGGTLGVSVWQIYINGKKPSSLPGSQNEKISVTFSD